MVRKDMKMLCNVGHGKERQVLGISLGLHVISYYKSF
jgi:hypothetical protein